MHQHAPVNVDVLQQQGELKHALKDHEATLQDLEEAHQLDSFSGDIFQQGEVKRIMQDLTSVLQNLGKVHQLDPCKVCILQQRGVIQQTLEGYKGAMEDLVKTFQFTHLMFTFFNK